MVKFKNPMPDTPEEWLKEATIAYMDAKETIPISSMTENPMTEGDLFHLAPVVCLKFRGIKRTKKILKQATDAALSSYVATEDINGELFADPFLAFAFCYLCSHFGLNIIDEEQFNEVMEYIEKKRV